MDREAWWVTVHGVAKSGTQLSDYAHTKRTDEPICRAAVEMQKTRVRSLGWEDLEKEMATQSRILAWEIPWTEEPGGLQFMVLQKSGP